jgi:cobalt-zinc-cadmium efflux system outer membrane protein
MDWQLTAKLWALFFLFAVRLQAQEPTQQSPSHLELAPKLVNLETALTWTLQSNPNLVAVRQNLAVSAEALAVAKQFPTFLNPSVSVASMPWVYEQQPGGGTARLQSSVTVNWAQPIELGNRTSYRAAIAGTSYSQTRWSILQAELNALVQTYRAHQTATYRRERVVVARRLVEFNQVLAATLRRQWDANQAQPADLVLAEVESQATQQQLEVSIQEYATALAELRQQIGLPQIAAQIEPLGPLIVPQNNLPTTPDALVQMAWQGRPEIRSAMSQVESSKAALSLAQADRIPIFSIGPVYEHNETGANFYGAGLSTPIPLLNAGNPLVRQREAELMRDTVALEQQRNLVATQVRALLEKWNRMQESADRTRTRIDPLRDLAGRMQRIYESGQTDVIKLLEVRRRLIEADNAQLDALWQSTQAYADLLTALGATPLMGSLAVSKAEGSRQ